MSLSAAPPYSVIVPAHNEGRVISRLLQGLLGGFAHDDPARPEVIVVCNGCSDDTAAVARSAAPGCKVIELAQGSKPLALNAGNAAATAYPRFFVDADILVTHRDLAAVAQALDEPGIHAAAPRIAIDLAGCSAPVRAYYKVWQCQPYVQRGMVGSGVFGLSKEGLEIVGEFPAIIADDGYVRSRFAEEQRRSIAKDREGHAVSFTVFPPRDLGSLLSIEARRRRGDAELRAKFPTAFAVRTTSGGSLLSSRKEGATLGQIMTYAAIKLGGRALFAFEKLTGRRAKWRRDESSRA